MCEPKARVPLRVPVLGAVALVAAGAVLAAAPSVVAAVVAVSVVILVACPVCAVAAWLFIARSRAGFGLRVEHRAPAVPVARPLRAPSAKVYWHGTVLPWRAAALARQLAAMEARPVTPPVLEGVVVTPVPAAVAQVRVRARG